MAVKTAVHKIRDYTPKREGGFRIYYAYCGFKFEAKTLNNSDFTSGLNFRCSACIDEYLSSLDVIREKLIAQKNESQFLKIKSEKIGE
jgi:hypothetical protein